LRGALPDLLVRPAPPRARGAPGRDPLDRAGDACVEERRAAVPRRPAPPFRLERARVRDAGRLRGDERALNLAARTRTRRLAEPVEATLRARRGRHGARGLRDLARAPGR